LLQAGQPGAAIEAFNFALATGEAPAPAYNGLGIAYARIARPDLAYRFFQKAKMSDPTNPTYAANLDRLVKSPQFTLDMAPRVVRPPAAETPPAAQGSQAGFAAKPDGSAAPSQPGRLRRTSAHQFSLTTLPVDANAAPPLMRRAQTKDCSARSGAPQRRGCPASPAASASSAKAPAAGLAAADPSAVVAPLPAAGKRKVIDLRSIPAAEVPANSTRTLDPHSTS
jgi:tetratricopeptide (TPR) repeat protein